MASTFISLPIESGGGGSGVSSFNGRTGAVIPQSGDYTASQITNVPAGNISATDVQSAINELDTEKQPIGNYITALTGDGTATGPGSAAFTLATVNGNAGSFTNASITVNAKGLITAASSGTAAVTSVTASAPLSSTGGATPNISITQSNTTTNGYLSSTDWNTFNNKQTAGNYITALTGDATASGPGSATITFATVNTNVGSFGTASSVGGFTVNAKGLITAASNTSIQIAESQVTNLISDLAGKQPVGNYITALTGDVTAAGPGSSAATLATVNTNVGTFGTSTSVSTFTVNAKGLVTAASNTAIAGASLPFAFTTGSVPFSNGTTLIQDNANLLFDTTNKILWSGSSIANRVINGTTVTGRFFSVSPATNDLDFVGSKYSATATIGASLSLMRSRGTPGSEAIVTTGDLLGRISAFGFDGTDFAQAAKIQFSAEGTVGSNVMPGKIELMTSAAGGQTPITALTINSAQLVSAAFGLSIVGSTTTDNLIFSGNINAPAWTTTGIKIKGTATFTDTTSSGTVAAAYTSVLGGSTIAASSATTYTNYYALYAMDPVAGTNVTFTNKWGFGADSMRIGTSNQMTVTNSGILTATNPIFLSNLTTDRITVSGNNISTASWGANGIRFAANNGGTFTDTSTAAAGTVALASLDTFGASFIDSTNTITVTNLIGTIFRTPVQGANTTVTNTIYSVGAESLAVGTPAIAALDYIVAGSTLPAGIYQSLNANNKAGGFVFNRSSATTTQAAEINLSKSKGTTAAKTAVATGDVLGRVNFLGHGGTYYDYGARIVATVTETTPTTGAMGSKLEFMTSPAGSATPATALTIASDKSATFAGSVITSGNISAAAWTTAGIRYKSIASTYTDTTSTGTVASVYVDAYASGTIAASSSTTYTNAYGTSFVAPTAGSNVTFTNKYGVAAENISIIGQSATYTSSPASFIAINTSHTWDFANVILPSGLMLGGTQTLNQSALSLAMGFGVNSQVTFKNTNAVTANLSSFYSLAAQNIFTADGANITQAAQTDVISGATFNRINSGTIAVTTYTGYSAGATIQAGATVTNRFGYQVAAATVAGTLTSQAAFNTASLTGATNNTHVLLGTTTIPTGNYGIYQSQGYVNRWAGGHQDPCRTDSTTSITFSAATDYAISGTNTGTVAISVPSATANPGLRLRFKKAGSGVNTNTLTSAAGNFDSTGSTTLAVTVQNTVVDIQSDGTSWIVFKNSVL